MSGEGLAFPHEREVEKLARRFRSRRRGGLAVCVGANEALRGRVEAALRARLGEAALVSAVIGAGCAHPWGVLLDARNEPGQLVSARIAPDVENAVLRALDVQRELLYGESLALMLWVGLGDLERFAGLASNVWSYRGDVAWFFTRTDIETSAGEGGDVPTDLPIDERLRAVESRLTSATAPRPDLLGEKAWLLRRSGRALEAWTVLDAARPHQQSGSFVEREWRFMAQSTLLDLGRYHEAHRLVEAAPDSVAPRVRLLERTSLSLFATAWTAAFSRIEQVVGAAYRWEVGDLERKVGPTCIQAATALLMLGQVSASERWLGEARKSARRRATDGWPLVAIEAEMTLGDISWERLDVIASLQALHRALHLATRAGALDEQVPVFDEFVARFSALGMESDTQHFRDLAGPVRDRLHADPPPPALADAPPERPVDTPFARLERAVWDAEHALDAGRADDLADALTRCAAAWDAEDERYRSLRLFDRWQRCLARDLAARGNPAGAVRALQAAAERLVDLPRTRLGTLVALAQLPLDATHDAAREAAANEVLSRAIPAGALALERDARLALAPIVRARGEVDEAAFHEAEAARIDDALADAPS